MRAMCQDLFKLACRFYDIVLQTEGAMFGATFAFLIICGVFRRLFG